MSQQIAKQNATQLAARRPTPRQTHSLDRARCYIEPGNDLLEGEQISGLMPAAFNFTCESAQTVDIPPIGMRELALTFDQRFLQLKRELS
jgi:hypothetical protein